MGKELNIMSKK